MAKSVNKVILVGNLGKDPEVKFTPSGVPVAKFSLATNERYKDKAGEWQDRTEWHNILAWERLADPKPDLTLIIYSPTGQEQVFYLGPHAPHLTPKEVDLLHGIWLELSQSVAPEELHHHDVVHFALQELRDDLDDSQRTQAVNRLRIHLQDIRERRAPRG